MYRTSSGFIQSKSTNIQKFLKFTHGNYKAHFTCDICDATIEKGSLTCLVQSSRHLCKMSSTSWMGGNSYALWHTTWPIGMHILYKKWAKFNFTEKEPTLFMKLPVVAIITFHRVNRAIYKETGYIEIWTGCIVYKREDRMDNARL